MMPWAEGDPALENHIEKAVEYIDEHDSPASGDGGGTLSLSNEGKMFTMACEGMMFQEVGPDRARRPHQGLGIPTSKIHPHLVDPALPSSDIPTQ